MPSRCSVSGSCLPDPCPNQGNTLRFGPLHRQQRPHLEGQIARSVCGHGGLTAAETNPKGPETETTTFQQRRVLRTAEVQKLRATVLAPLCQEHCRKLKKERLSGKPVTIAFRQRLAWAHGSWMNALNKAVFLLGHRHEELNIMRDGLPDIWLAEQLEALVRGSIHLHSRSMSIWCGGL